jgi:transcriptional regulator with XRE-family HTH domain
MQGNADLNDLSAKQKRVAELLAAGFTRAEAAKRAGVGERTVYLWLNNESFQRYIRAEQARLRGELTSVLRRSVMKAVTVLEAALDSSDDERKILAARALLSAGAKLLAMLETAELHEKVEQIERRLAGVSTDGYQASH